MQENWEHIKQLSKMETPEDVVAFDEELGKLAQKKDAITLYNLMDLFDDSCPHYEVMFGLIHLVETWPDQIFITTLIKNIDSYFSKATFWITTILYRIMNHNPSLEFFRQNMNLAPRESLLKLFDLMEKESPHHQSLIQELRKELKDGSH